MNGIQHPGFGLMPSHIALDVHFYDRGRENPDHVNAVLNEEGVCLLIGINEDGGVTRQGHKYSVMGNNNPQAMIAIRDLEDTRGWSSRGRGDDAYYFIEYSDGEEFSLPNCGGNGEGDGSSPFWMGR